MANSGTPMLEIKNLSVSYGPAQALSEVSLRVEAGEAVALLGSNGAGKSTLGKSVAGLVRSRGGTISFNGHDISGYPSHRLGRMGLAYIPEGRGIFPGLSVIDNLKLFLRRVGPREKLNERIESAFEYFPVLAQRQQQRAGTLSGGEQQMLSLARVMVGKPQVIIADELSLGLAPLVVNSIFASLARAREEGATIILIEQFAHKALQFADTCFILQRGRLTWGGPAREAKEEVLNRYLGGEMAGAGAEGEGSSRADVV